MVFLWTCLQRVVTHYLPLTSQMPRDGNLRLDIKFHIALPDSINVMVYGIFDAEIQITKDNTIICD